MKTLFNMIFEKLFNIPKVGEVYARKDLAPWDPNRFAKVVACAEGWVQYETVYGNRADITIIMFKLTHKKDHTKN